MLNRFCLVVAFGIIAAGCSFTPSGAAGDPDAASLDAVLVDSRPTDAPVDALVAMGCVLGVPAGDDAGFRAGVARPIMWSAATANRIVVRTTSSIGGWADGQLLYDRIANTGSLDGTADISFPPGATELRIDCEGDAGTTVMQANLDVNAILVNITPQLGPDQVRVGQPGFDITWSAPSLSGNVCAWNGFDLQALPNYPSSGLVHRVWDLTGPFQVSVECGSGAMLYHAKWTVEVVATL